MTEGKQELSDSQAVWLLHFFQAVRDMRAAQTRYFRTRDREALIAAFQLEKRVDHLLSKTTVGSIKPQTTGDTEHEN
jgi:hypothetical protein